MRKTEIHIRQWFRVRPEVVFSWFQRQENLGQIWPGRFRRVRDSIGADPNGPGAVREVRLPGIRFREQIVRCEVPRLIEYRMIQRPPLIRANRGLLRFTPEAGGTLLDYRIELETWVPGADALARLIEPALRRGIEELALKWE